MTVDVAVDAATDAAGNGNMAATRASSTYTASSANTAPTAANNTVTTAEDRAYTFTAADFGFMDADAGAALASVKIVTVPTPGDAGAQRHGGPGGRRRHQGPDRRRHAHLHARGAMRSGDPYTTFTFKVNDGTDDSASAYTMTIDVTDSPAPVCTAPSFGDRREIWTGTVTVGTGGTFFHGFDASSLLGALVGSLDETDVQTSAGTPITSGEFTSSIQTTFLVAPLAATSNSS